MPPSKPIQTPIERPSIELCGLRVFITRKGTHVTGKAVFPHTVGGDLDEAERVWREGKRIGGRTECPINYRSKRPDGSESATHTPQSATTVRAKQKANAVQAYWDICGKQPDVPRKQLAAKVVEAARDDGNDLISVRTLQHWARTVELGGWPALRDRYVKPAPKVPTFDPKHAREALLVCAWWCFRIGNVKAIDTKMMAIVVSLIARGYPAADLVATIDCYYAYSCNRERYPFKTFARWIRHDLAKWMHRAADANDYRHAVAEGRRETTPLQTVERLPTTQRSVATTARRKRDAANHRTRSDIHRLSQTSATSASPELPPLAANEDPQTVAESLALLDDVWRCMLLRAAGSDSNPAARDARRQAAATLPMWWDSMPRSVTGDIDFRSEQWRRAHPGVTDDDMNSRRFLMFQPHLRHKNGTERLAVAMRIAT